tara:strand:+ start:187 stop:1089 length:903 start_codon:yes stop_codon:yes gene_type:complete
LDQLNTLPNLFIVGAAKSGTTSLHNYLNQHPDIFMCSPKEPHFLINNEIGKNRIHAGICSEQKYLDLFLNGKSKKYRGESSVMYLMFPEIVIPKINEKYGKDCKIIIMLRNPIERAYSGFQHVKRYNVKENSLDFKSAWDICEDRYFEMHDMTPASRYKELGMYYKQVKAYLDGIQQVHVIIYDDYKKNFKHEMERIFDFLSLDKIQINSKRKHMVGGWQWKNQKIKKLMTQKNALKSFLKILVPFRAIRKSIRNKIQNINTLEVLAMKQDDREMLKVFYQEDVKQLSVLLKKNLNHWIE